MQARYSKAHWRPLRFAGSMPARQQKHAVILHTNGGGAAVFDYFSRPDNKDDIASHFQVFNDGRIEQYIGCDKVAYAAYASNGWAIQVETEDDGHPERPWTKAQLAAIIGICKWAGCPAKPLAESPSDGVGWHAQYHSWNLHSHSCPGAVRIAQIEHVIIPALKPQPKPTKVVKVVPGRWAKFKAGHKKLWSWLKGKR